MGKKNWIVGLAASAAASAALFATPAQAQVNASVYVQVAPPPPRYEVAPPPRHGQAWVPGHWEWRPRRQQYVWIPGVFVVARPGYYYSQPQWVQYGNRWGYHAGGWARGDRHWNGRRDQDRDGIPDRRDRDRDNDGIRNRHDRDRDGDGVPNRYDRQPDNRYRR